MAFYLKITANATIKIQDPNPTEEELEEIKDNIHLECFGELVHEDYHFEVIDSD